MAGAVSSDSFGRLGSSEAATEQAAERYVGFDANSKQIACVILNEDGSYARSSMLPTVVKRGAESRERLYAIADAVRTFLTADGQPTDEIIGMIEEIPFVRNRGAALTLAYTVGAVMIEAYRANVFLVPVNVSTWKSRTVGNGKAEKPEIKTWALKNIPGMPENLVQDLYDAACIARFAYRNING